MAVVDSMIIKFNMVHETALVAYTMPRIRCSKKAIISMYLQKFGELPSSCLICSVEIEVIGQKCTRTQSKERTRSGDDGIGMSKDIEEIGGFSYMEKVT